MRRRQGDQTRTRLGIDPERSDDEGEEGETRREWKENVKRPSDGKTNMWGTGRRRGREQGPNHYTTRSNGEHEESISREAKEDGHSKRIWSGMTLNYHHGEATEERKSYEINSQHSANTKSEETINNLELSQCTHGS